MIEPRSHFEGPTLPSGVTKTLAYTETVEVNTPMKPVFALRTVTSPPVEILVQARLAAPQFDH